MKTRIARIAGASFLLIVSLSPGQARASSFYLESTVFPGFSSSHFMSNGSNSLQQIGGNFSGQAQNPKSGFSYDLRNTGGFKLWDKMLVGFTYNYSRNPQSATAADDNASLNAVTKKSEYGPAIGYVGSNFRILFSYFLGGTETYSETSADQAGVEQSNFSLTNHTKSGYQIVVGYSFNISSSIQIGPSLVYRHVTYKSQDSVNNLALGDPNQNYTDRAFTSDISESNLTPMISLIFQLF